MRMKRSGRKGSGLAIVTAMVLGMAALAPLPAAATPIHHYRVSSTSVINCGDARHGLWTHDFKLHTGSDCSEYYDISGDFRIVDDGAGNWLGHLEASAVNPHGTLADIDMWFEDFTTEDGVWKSEVGNPEPTDAWYFQAIGESSTIEFHETDGSEPMSFLFDAFEIVDPYSLQIGTGGNNKNPEAFGASMWFLAGVTDTGLGTVDLRDKHWDLNLNFHEVPLPATLPLLLAGLLGLGAFARRHRTA